MMLQFAMARFGLGPRRDSAMGMDGRDWVQAQLAMPPAHLPANLPGRADVATTVSNFFQSRRQQRQLLEAVEGEPSPQNTQRMLRQPIVREVLTLAGARLDTALSTKAQLAERLTHFWSNHFATSTRKAGVFGFAGLLEYEAIRPHVMGRFEDMLLGVIRHPAMLLYLDQAQSIGPKSRIAQFAARRGRDLGLNENLAREILELHTLGVRSGYDQDDVTELARALTGWTVAGLARGPLSRFTSGAPGDFAFVEQMHEPGTRMLLGQRFAADGAGQGAAMLRMLAARPETARHLATKMARHFAGDEPPEALVARLETAYLESDGNLGAMTRALVDSPEAWTPLTPKFRNPWDWMVASLRAVGSRDLEPQIGQGILRELGQQTWQVPSPAGWDDLAASWAGPDALVRRVEVAQRIADRAGSVLDARSLAPQILGDGLSDATATAIRRAESPSTGLALLLSSPEMLRR